MIEFLNGVRLVQSVDELPQLTGAADLFVDFETTSGDPKIKSTNPWHNCDVLGICITVDAHPGAWYIPVGHVHGGNLPREPVQVWWARILAGATRWINHNVKYDAHVSANCLDAVPTCSLVCSLTLAKIVDSDRIMRGGYSLEALSSGWLKEDIGKYNQALKPYLYRNQDYGRIPVDIMAEYGGQDVLTGRRLYHYLEAQCPEECRGVWDTEIAVTPALFKMERNGLGVSKTEVQITELRHLNRMAELDGELEDIVGRPFRPNSREDCYDVLCNQYDLPVMKWTNADDASKASNPSFDKEAMAKYEAHPYAPEGVINRVAEYRKLSTQRGLFLEPYAELQIDGLLHSDYNQAVRTGRLSAKTPNAQQLDKMAKSLIHPRAGNTFVSIDYSQIEFRLIVHYINDAAAIAAYAANPDTDFHAWVAEMCAIARSPAKSVNFCMGYGGGKKKLVAMLATNIDLVGELKAHVAKLVESGEVKESQKMQVFTMLCTRRASKVYDAYHETLPGLKRTSYAAARASERRGYVFNLYGRHRRLPYNQSYRAFNSLNQSSAADLMKERLVALDRACDRTPIMLVACVHDEVLFEMPHAVADDPRTMRDLVGIMESPQVKLRVPIRVSAGVSRENWAIAGGDDGEISLDRANWGEAEELRWLVGRGPEP